MSTPATPSPACATARRPAPRTRILLHLYTFIPKKLDQTKKQPLIVFVHQGVHASLDTTIDAHLVRELVQQGYTVVASDYRGSTGYGQRPLPGDRLRRPRGRRRL